MNGPSLLRAWQGSDEAAYIDWIYADGSILRSIVVIVSSNGESISISDVANPGGTELGPIRLSIPLIPLVPSDPIKEGR